MQFDTIVIGAGSMGMAAGYFLAKEGLHTICIDAFTPPHDFGSHHGDTRLIRYAYGEGEKYVPFVLRAKTLWEELAKATNADIFRQVGILNMAPEGLPQMDTIFSSAEKFHLDVEKLTAAQVNERWPGINVPSNTVACFEPTSGVLLTENILNAYFHLAKQHGVQFHTNDGVQSINIISDNQVRVTTAAGHTFEAKKLVISVGAWAKEILAKVNVDVPVHATRKTFAWFECDDALYGEQHFPGFSYMTEESSFYGFPSIDGAGFKVGRHDGGLAINPNEEKQPFGEVAGDAEDLQQFLHTIMPQVGTLKCGKTCMYAMTPDEDFIIDVHPQFTNVALAAGFSGHGFKFSSAVGEALKDLVLHQPTKVDLSMFSLSRFNK